MPMDHLQLQAIFGRNNIDPDPNASAGDPVKTAFDLYNDVQQTFSNFAAEAEQVKNDPDLTPQGKRNKLAKLTADYEQSEGKRDRFLNQLRGIVNRRHEAITEERSTDPAVIMRESIREWEVRSQLPVDDPIMLGQHLTEAVDAGDETTYRAITEAPKALTAIQQKDVDHARQRWAERQNPQQAAELKHLTHALTEAESARNAAINAARDLSGVHPDPIADQAEGDAA